MPTATPTISGTAGNGLGDGANVSVNVMQGVTVIRTFTVTRTGTTWTVGPTDWAAGSPTSLPDGLYTVTAYADRLGRQHRREHPDNVPRGQRRPGGRRHRAGAQRERVELRDCVRRVRVVFTSARPEPSAEPQLTPAAAGSAASG